MSNEEYKLLGAKVPQEWIEKFEKLAKQTGSEVNELVRDALAQYIGIDQNSSRIISQLDQFQIELKLQRQKIGEIELYKTQIRDLSVRLAILEQNLGKSQSQLFSMNSQSSSEALLIKDESDEVDIDEPDEILTDFLPRTLEN